VPEEQREAALVELANRLLPADTHSAPLHLMRRLARCVDRLNGLHYHARWEAHAAGPRIILGHCPYITIINEHPELCRMDALLLQGQLDHAVEQLVKLETSERGLRYCVFAVE
jgi:predicted ArsR family transcriptional regulator